MYKILTLFCYLLSINLLYSQSDILRYKKSIDTINLKSDIGFISSLEMEGREISGKGILNTGFFIANQFEKIGLQKYNNSFYQDFSAIRINPPEKPELFIKNKSERIKIPIYGKDFIPAFHGLLNNLSDCELVFAGYGITDSINNYDDYKNINIENKVVLLLPGYPADQNNNGPFNYKSEKYKNIISKVNDAKKRGARGVLLLDNNFYSDNNTNQLSFSLPQRPIYKLSTEPMEPQIPLIVISKNLANEILLNSGKTIENLKKIIDSTLTPYSLNLLNTSINFKPDIHTEMINTRNVIGFLEGSDPQLKNEFIVFSAHYDHLGRTNENIVYPGADDNASGVSGVINIARAFIKSDLKPKRSILFIAFSGEEKGLLGSYYFVNNFSQISNVYAALNMDMIGRIDPKHDSLGIKEYIYVIGPTIQETQITSVINEINSNSINLILDYSFDSLKDPNRWFFRSDHYPFTTKKIIGIRFFDGGHVDYHKVTDIIDKIDFKLLKKRIEFIGSLGYQLANCSEKFEVNKIIPNLR